MPEHVHLIVSPHEKTYDIARIRQAIKEPIARKAIEYLTLNAPEWLSRITVIKGRRTRRCFWQQGGGYERNIVEPRTLMRMIDDIHNHPVRRGLVERAHDWQGCSAAWFEAMIQSPVRLDRIPPEWVPNE